MEIKKNANAKLENYSRLFLQLGLVLALLIVYLSLEYKVYEREIDHLQGNINQNEIEEIISSIGFAHDRINMLAYSRIKQLNEERDKTCIL